MRITVLCTDPSHPVIPELHRWRLAQNATGHDVHLVHDKRHLAGGDILFLVSCIQVLSRSDRQGFRSTLVLHASDLPRGRGWSPHIWAIVNGEEEITVSLLEADDSIDSGKIWLQRKFHLEGHELLPEINERLFHAELELMSQAVDRFGEITPRIQKGNAGPYLRRRTPEDSRLDPNKTIAQQFNLLRVVDSQRFPAFFEFNGKKYLIKIEKAQGDET